MSSSFYTRHLADLESTEPLAHPDWPTHATSGYLRVVRKNSWQEERDIDPENPDALYPVPEPETPQRDLFK